MKTRGYAASLADTCRAVRLAAIETDAAMMRASERPRSPAMPSIRSVRTVGAARPAQPRLTSDFTKPIGRVSLELREQERDPPQCCRARSRLRACHLGRSGQLRTLRWKAAGCLLGTLRSRGAKRQISVDSRMRSNGESSARIYTTTTWACAPFKNVSTSRS
jgi:hypothetical protein